MAASAAKSTAAKSKDYYYEKDPITNADGNGQNLVWGGKGAAELGLEGNAKQEDFSNIMQQKDQNGNVLRDTTNMTGEKVDTLDVVFAAPKSVSLLAFGGEGNQEIIKIHNEAVKSAMNYLEDNHANIKKVVNGERITENQGNLTYATALHSGARGDKLSDPHLHSHNVISNMVKDKETGEYRALAMKPLLDHLKTADQIYKSEMAKNLVKAGYQLEDKKHGWDIKMDQKVIDTFSSRSKEITSQVIEKWSDKHDQKEIDNAVLNAYEETTGKSAEGLSTKEMIEQGGTGGNQKEFLETVAAELGEEYSNKDKYFAQHSFKDDKKNWNAQELKEAWEDKLQQEAGVRSFADLDNEARGEMNFRFDSEKEVLEKTMELLTQNEAVIEEKKLLKEATEVATGQFSYEDLKVELDNVKKIGQKEGHELKRVDDTSFTTKEMHDIERENINMIKNSGKSGALLTPEQAKAGLADFEKNNFKMKEGQYNAAYTILTSEENLLTVQGVAGAGKTASLKAINHALDFNDRQVDVTLLAPTNKAVSGAVEESKIENGKEFEGKTTAKFIMDSQKEPEELKDIMPDQNSKSDNNVDTDSKNNKDIKSNSKQKDIKSENNIEKIDSKSKDSDQNLKTDSKINNHSKDITSNNDKSIKSDNNSKKANINYGITKSNTKSQSELYISNGNFAFAKKSSKYHMAVQKTKLGDTQTSVKTIHRRMSYIQTGDFKGGKKFEQWDTKKGTYTMNVDFKDGSKYRSEMKSYGQIDNRSVKNFIGSAIGKAVSSGTKKTVMNNMGEKSVERSDTLLGMTLKTKNVNNRFGNSQSKISFDALKVAKLEKNVVTKKNWNNNFKETTKSASLAGFKATTMKEEVFNKTGELVGLRTTKEKTFMGYTIKKEVSVASREDLNKLNGKADLNIKKTKEIDSDSKQKDLKSDKDIKKIDSKSKDSDKDIKSDSKVENKDIKSDKNIEKIDSKSNKDTKSDSKIDSKSKDSEKATSTEFKNVDSKKALEVAEKNNQIEIQDKVIIIDESSMNSARDLNVILKAASEQNYKVVNVGDHAQLQSIGAGKAFDQLLENTKVVEMKESVRQQNDSEKIIANNVRDKDTMHKTFNELKESGKIHEIKDEATRVDAVASAAIKEEVLSGVKPNGEKFTQKVDYKSNISITGTNEDNELLNNAIRDKLHAKGEINKNDNVKATVLQPKNIEGVKQLRADNFEKGQIISTFEKGLGIKVGTSYELVSKDTKNNTLMLKAHNTKTGQDEFRKVDLKKAAGHLQVDEKKEREFSKGDIVVVTKTDKKSGILNSDRGIVVGFDKEKQSIKVDFGEKGTKNIDLSKGDKGVNYGYSITTHKGQGISVARIQALVNTEKLGTTLNATHVQMTRQKLKAELFVDNVKKAFSQSMQKQEKTSTLDYADKKAEKAQQAKTEKLDVKEASKEVKNEVQEAKKEAGDIKRTGRKLDYNDVKEAVQKSAAERNEGKAAGDNEQYRKGQESFMNNQVVLRNGYDKEAVQSFADQAVKSNRMHAEDAAQFVDNTQKHAEALKNVGILKDDGNGKMSFTDSKSREILFDNANKDINEIGKANAEAYKEAAQENNKDIKSDSKVENETKSDNTKSGSNDKDVQADSKVENQDKDIKSDSNDKGVETSNAQEAKSDNEKHSDSEEKTQNKDMSNNEQALDTSNAKQAETQAENQENVK